MQVNVPEVKSYLEHLAKHLRISKPEHWYCVTLKQIREVPDYKAIPQRLGGLPGMLIRVYPEHPWDLNKFSFGSYRTTTMGALKPALRPAPAVRRKTKNDKEFEKHQEREKLALHDADS